jgi:hypothetical protein
MAVSFDLREARKKANTPTGTAASVMFPDKHAYQAVARGTKSRGSTQLCHTSPHSLCVVQAQFLGCHFISWNFLVSSFPFSTTYDLSTLHLMVYPIPHELHDLYITPALSARRCTDFSPSRLGLLLLVAPQFLFGRVTAVPLASYDLNGRSLFLEKRDSDQDVSPKIWVCSQSLSAEFFSHDLQVPILVITVVLALLSILSCQRNSIRQRFTPFRWRTRAVDSAVAGAQRTREITAEQLAGTINGTVPPASAPAPRTRRNRRPRRTPSQISTTSLPAYNKEPGEEELVIFR